MGEFPHVCELFQGGPNGPDRCVVCHRAMLEVISDQRAELSAARERIEKLEAALRRLADEVDASNGLIAKGRAMIGPAAAELMLIDGVRLSPKQAKP